MELINSDLDEADSGSKKSEDSRAMPCYNPTRVVMGGDHRLHFDRDWRFSQLIDNETIINVPCRRCIGCNQATQREWAVRGFHEAQLHSANWTDLDTKITTEIPNSSVITLTYNEEHLPENRCLNHEHFQNFMKRLRIRRHRRHQAEGRPGQSKPIRYFMCGEYGGKTQRPHYHAVIFGETFDDQYTEQSRDGQTNQMSYELDELWTQKIPGTDTRTNIGRATVDCFSFAGASYVAGYVAKKQNAGNITHNGPIKTTTDAHGTTRFVPIAPEYRKMSTHPGIGADWLLDPENMASVYSIDAIKISEWTFHPPKYYDLLLNRHRPELVQDIILNRRKGMSQVAEEWGLDRCAAAEAIALSSLQLRRDSL